MDKDKNTSNDDICTEFQDNVSKVLVRHKSVLDIMTKMDQYNARINRAMVKAVTSCGCMSIDAKKQEYKGESYKDLPNLLDSHLKGKICNQCKEVLELEMGNYLFYLTALCETVGIKLSDVIQNEYDRNKTLGLYNLR